MLKRTIYFVFAAVLLTFSGCSSDLDKLNQVCEDIEKASLMTDDCERMAKALKPATEDFNAAIARMNTTVPSESEKPYYIDATSICLRHYLEIETGTCGKHPAVAPILSSR